MYICTVAATLGKQDTIEHIRYTCKSKNKVIYDYFHTTAKKSRDLMCCMCPRGGWPRVINA